MRSRLCLWSDFVMQETVRQYHRRSRRISIGEPVRLVPSLPRGHFYEEIATTSNVSREGFYFLTKREHYEEGMRLLVTLPYHSPRERRDREYLAQVVRVELLGDGQRGVAVQLLSSVGGPQ
jgi:PilZ domain